MEPNGLHGGLFSDIGSGMLGLEKPLHPPPPPGQQQQQPENSLIQSQTNPQNPHLYPQMVAYSHQHDTQTHQSVKQHGYLFIPKPKQQLSPLSDEDELGLNTDDGAGDGKRKASPSPWHRMKWTDSMVKLLILAVLYIGDEVGSEANDKKKTGALLQKKGKWKSVSRAMMERGFYVSPQQCEDKFNDLNKRYKRVNEILGKGTACLVVENQSLLDTMDLSPKMKDEVKKLLNSKHLFFKEMCAYHNNCNHVGSSSGATGANHSSEVATEPSQVQRQQAQQRCLHSSENAQHEVNLIRAETEGLKLVRAGSEEEDDVEDESDDEDDYEEDDEAVGNSRAQNGHGQEDEDENDEKQSQKRQRKDRFSVPMSALMQQLSYELMNVIQDAGKSAWEKKQWMKMKLVQLEEQQVSYQYQACELEKQRLKWVKFSSKKEREMERAKLENERRRLENERMVLVVRQKELALLDLHHHQYHHQQHSSTKRSDPSSITG